MFKTQIKFAIFPILIFIIVILFASFNIHGSSIGEFHKILYPGQEDPYLLFGQSRGIRSDEWMAGTPQLISQMRNDLPIINEDMAMGINLGYGYGAPTESIFTIFKPQLWIFVLVNNIDFAYSFFWWFRIALLIVSFYLLLLELTKKNISLSILGSTLLFFTPFIQWWLGFDTITMISFGLYFFIKIIKEKLSINHIVYTLGFTFSMTSFALILYPPYQVPLAWIAFFMGIGILLQNKKELIEDKMGSFKKFLLLVFSLTIVGLIMYLYFQIFADVISIMTKTSYPGERFIVPGLGDIHKMLSGFFNILLQKNSNGVPYGNQSEASSFFMLFPFLSLWVIYINIKTFLRKKTVDWVGLSLVLGLIFLTSWYALPLPVIFSKMTLLYMVTPERLIIGLGYANSLLVMHMLSSKFYTLKIIHRLDVILATIITGFTAITYYNVGKYLYGLNPNFFYWPTILTPELKIFGVVGLTSLLVVLIILRKKISLVVLIVFALFSTMLVNPLYKSLDVITETPLAREIQNLSTKDDSGWIVYGNYVYTHYILANNGHVINGMHNYPQFEMWRILDPNGEYSHIYNRFAHIFFSEYTNGEELVKLNQNDAIEINVNPCDPILEKLNVKYVLSTEELQDGTCLRKVNSLQGAIIYIIER